MNNEHRQEDDSTEEDKKEKENYDTEIVRLGDVSITYDFLDEIRSRGSG